MENIARSIGLPLPMFSAKKAVMKRFEFFRSDSYRDRIMPEMSQCYCKSSKLSSHRDAISSMCRPFSEVDDDETASTISSSADDSLSSVSFSCGTVSFAEPLVTEIHTRPVTTDAEKHRLYYNDSDYRQFRREFIHRKKVCRVRFPPTSAVTNVYEYQLPDNSESFYYSQLDLQRFLDEFVLSLNEGCRET